jgi:hypothetical protein
MHQAMAAGHLTSSLVPNSAVPHGAYSPGAVGGLGGGGGPGSRSPVSSPTPQPPPPLGVPAGHMVGGYGGAGHVTPGHNTSGGGGGGNDGGLSSDCSDDEGSPGAGGHMPVVYPWMKKIHVTGSGRKITALIMPRRFRSFCMNQHFFFHDYHGSFATLPTTTHLH